MNKKIAVMVADGSEPVEVIAPVDVLRRGGINVQLISVMPSDELTFAQNVKVTADAKVGEVDLMEFDGILVPGGSVGVENLAKNEKLTCALKDFMAQGKFVFSICAGPTILASLGLLEGRTATCYPGCETTFPNGVFPEKLGVYRDENLVTASGPGFAIDFGIECLRAVAGDSTADSVAKDMLIS